PRTSATLHLWVVGEGDPSRIRASTTFTRIDFFGRRADAERFYAAANIFVLPSMYEAAPLVSYEAAASGLPIVATRVGGVDELVGDDQACGLLVERSPEAVGAAIAWLAENSEVRRAMGAEGRRRASIFTWERSAAAVASLYRELLQEVA
ncbi:MAG: glycosyltransferase, partial [Chloroflexota bacterium]